MALLVDMTLGRFTDELAADTAAPGGGSVAALSGALAASLVSMVCRLTIGKKGYEEFEEEVKEVLGESDGLRRTLLDAIDIDAKAFEKVMEAFAAPKGTDDEKAERRELIQSAFKGACESPRDTAIGCLQVLRLCARIADKSNTNAASDLGVAATVALAGLEGAVMNVFINLSSIKDEDYVDDMESQMETLHEEGAILKAGVLRVVPGDL
ncbi:MAG: cyclodeaminase/cyclohydrolase family protein [Synergistota bacterium]|nr:cyclodeaminase/cyclohydrolase family protein [Synergistota bacterium]